MLEATVSWLLERQDGAEAIACAGISLWVVGALAFAFWPLNPADFAPAPLPEEDR